MAEEKCFCHFNGYQVKDSVARKQIEELREGSSMGSPIKLHVLKSKTTQDISVLQIGDINILIDAGKANNSADTFNDYTAATEHVTELKNLGITKFDYIYITHYHSDHVGGLAEICKNINVAGATIFCPEYLTDAEIALTKETIAPHIQSVKNVISTYNLKVVHPSATNNTFDINGATFQFLNYDKSYYFNSSNYPANYSSKGVDYNNLCLCCVVSYGAVRFGFFADVSYIAQKRLAGSIGHLDLMNVEHHGLNAWMYRPFFDNIAPKMCFTQNGFGAAGRDADDGGLIRLATRSRTQTYLQDNGIPNFSTGENGSITFNIFGANITTSAKAVQYASKSIKSTTSILGAINADYSESTNISLITILKNMEHGTFVATRIDSSAQSKIWDKIVKPFVPSNIEHAQIIFYKGGSAGHNQTVKDYGFITVLPETSNPLVGPIEGQWDIPSKATGYTAGLNIIMRPNSRFEHFKIWRGESSSQFSKSDHSSNLITVSGNNVSVGASCCINYAVYLRNCTASDINYTYSVDGSETTKLITGGSGKMDVLMDCNITDLTSGDTAFNFPVKSGMYVRVTGFITYQLGNSDTITLTAEELDNSVPSFNTYPYF